MANIKRSFQGVWIPAEIWLDNDLSWIEKLVFTEIVSLNKNEECYASNNYFAKFFSLTPTRISQIISTLVEKKYIEATFEWEGKRIKRRVLKILNRGIKYSKKGIKNIKGGYLENYKENNTNINNTINNINTETAIAVSVKDVDKELFHKIKEVFESRQLNCRFSDYKKEGSAIKGLIKKAKLKAPENYEIFIGRMIELFSRLRETDSRFFGTQPFLPSALNASGIFDRVLVELERELTRSVNTTADIEIKW